MTIVLYMVAVVAGFFIVLQGYIWLTSQFRKGKNVPELNGELDRKIKTGQRLLLYFYSPSCSACRTMTPIIEKMKNENKNVVKINVQNDFLTARKLGVMGTPATVVIENSRINQFILGARPENFLRKLI